MAASSIDWRTVEEGFFLRRFLNHWYLKCMRNRASALAVWAVDQGYNKIRETARMFSAEDSWILRNISWDGYSHHPISGATTSGWFWAQCLAETLGDRGKRILQDELEVRVYIARLCTVRLASFCFYMRMSHRAEFRSSITFAQAERRKNAALNEHLEVAREQLVEWQAVADFRMAHGGAWRSRKIKTSERELLSLRSESNAAQVALRRDDSCLSDDDSEHLEDQATYSCRSWMWDFESERTVISTIPGLVANRSKREDRDLDRDLDQDQNFDQDRNQDRDQDRNQSDWTVTSTIHAPDPFPLVPGTPDSSSYSPLGTAATGRSRAVNARPQEPTATSFCGALGAAEIPGPRSPPPHDIYTAPPLSPGRSLTNTPVHAASSPPRAQPTEAEELASKVRLLQREAARLREDNRRLRAAAWRRAEKERQIERLRELVRRGEVDAAARATRLEETVALAAQMGDDLAWVL